MALRAKIIDFIRLQLVEELHESDGISQVPVMQEQVYPIHVRILIEMINPRGVKGAGSSDDSVDFVALR
jgi:hypothetical protein